MSGTVKPFPFPTDQPQGNLGRTYDRCSAIKHIPTVGMCSRPVSREECLCNAEERSGAYEIFFPVCIKFHTTKWITASWQRKQSCIIDMCSPHCSLSWLSFSTRPVLQILILGSPPVQIHFAVNLLLHPLFHPELLSSITGKELWF